MISNDNTVTHPAAFSRSESQKIKKEIQRIIKQKINKGEKEFNVNTFNLCNKDDWEKSSFKIIFDRYKDFNYSDYVIAELANVDETYIDKRVCSTSISAFGRFLKNAISNMKEVFEITNYKKLQYKYIEGSNNEKN